MTFDELSRNCIGIRTLKQSRGDMASKLAYQLGENAKALGLSEVRFIDRDAHSGYRVDVRTAYKNQDGYDGKTNVVIGTCTFRCKKAKTFPYVFTGYDGKKHTGWHDGFELTSLEFIPFQEFSNDDMADIRDEAIGLSIEWLQEKAEETVRVLGRNTGLVNALTEALKLYQDLPADQRAIVRTEISKRGAPSLLRW